MVPFGPRSNLALVALLAAVACLFLSCSEWPFAQCEQDEKRCTDDGVERCETNNGTHWEKTVCAAGTVCVEGAFVCALSSVKDPRCSAVKNCDYSSCVGNGDVCDGNTLVTCSAGYATAAAECPAQTACGPWRGMTTCVDVPTLDPACNSSVSDYYRCSGSLEVRCNGAYRVSKRDCMNACTDCEDPAHPWQCVDTAQGTGCVPAGPPDAVCANTPFFETIVCDGSAMVTCTLGYMVGRKVCRSCGMDADAGAVGCSGALSSACAVTTDCADGLVCRANEWGGRACTGPCATTADCIFLDQGTAETFESPYYSLLYCIDGWCK